jgi:zinc finger protein ZFPM1
MHFDKKTVDFNEENYITCIVEEDGVEITASKASPPVLANNTVSGPLVSVQENSTQMHYCDMCHYSSTYKGNVVSSPQV